MHLAAGHDGHGEEVFVHLAVQLENVDDLVLSLGLWAAAGVSGHGVYIPPRG